MSETTTTTSAPVAQTGSTGGAGGNSQVAAATTPAPTATDWTSSLSPELKGLVETKGFKDPGMALESYRNLEKLVGTPQERLLKLPEKADDAAWGDIFNKLGRPSKADEYQFQLPKEMGDENTAKWAKETFHKLGLTKTQAEKLMTEWTQQNKAMLEASENAKITKNETENNTLKREWGMAFDQNINVAKQAVREFGLDSETIDKLEDALGFAGVMKFMHQVGSKMGEDSFTVGDRRQSFGALTPDAARHQINALRADNDFIRRYTNGDVEAKQKMEKLHQMAYPEQA